MFPKVDLTSGFRNRLQSVQMMKVRALRLKKYHSEMLGSISEVVAVLHIGSVETQTKVDKAPNKG